MSGDSGSGREHSGEDPDHPASPAGAPASLDWPAANLSGSTGGPANMSPISLLEQSLVDRQHREDLAGQARVLARLAAARYVAGDAGGAGAAAAECERVALLAEDADSRPWGSLVLSLLAYDRGDLDEALVHAQDSLGLFRATGDDTHVWRATMTCMLALKSLGRLMEARDHCLDTIQEVEGRGDEEMATALPELAGLVLALGYTSEAIVAYSAGLTAAERLGVRYPPTAFERYRTRIATARSRLPEAEFAAARVQGESLPLPRALELVRRCVKTGRSRTTLPA